MKPRLLDLFCGAFVCYNKSWLHSCVLIAGKRQLDNAAPGNSARGRVPIDPFGLPKRCVVAGIVGRNSLLRALPMLTGNIVPGPAPRTITQRLSRTGGSFTLICSRRTGRTNLPKILTTEGLSPPEEGSASLIYWDALVLYVASQTPHGCM